MNTFMNAGSQLDEFEASLFGDDTVVLAAYSNHWRALSVHMTPAQARKLALDLQAAARQGEALVGIQTGNSDLEPAQHSTLEAAA